MVLFSLRQQKAFLTQPPSLHTMEVQPFKHGPDVTGAIQTYMQLPCSLHNLIFKAFALLYDRCHIFMSHQTICEICSELNTN